MGSPFGWLNDRGLAAADALMRRGKKGLALLIIRICASFPWECFWTYKKIAAAVAKWYGREPHPESVGRIIRALKDEGLVSHRRVYPGHKVPGMKYSSPHGTTATDFQFRKLHERDPIPASARRKMRHEQIEHRRAVAGTYNTALTKPASNAPPRQRHTVQPSELNTASAPAMPADLAAAIEGARNAMQPRYERQDARRQRREEDQDAATIASVQRVRGPP